ncbi:MAG: L,D-transpeptidase [Synechococcaceae cyanobacterium]
MRVPPRRDLACACLLAAIGVAPAWAAPEVAPEASALMLGSEPLVIQATPAPGPPAPARPASPAPQTELVLDRSGRVLRVMADGKELRRFPVAVGMPGWETPVGRFQVIEMAADPVWKHPAKGTIYPPGPTNPLGSRWIGFHRDCRDRAGFNGVEHLQVKGCATAGFHGTNDRASVGQAASHGCVRLFDEHVRELYQLVRLGTPVTVLP